MRKLVLSCLGLSLIFSAQGQTLFTFGSTPVEKKEFLRVYEKNSTNKKPDFSEKALRDYLDLYTLFRMKVAEAEEQQLDTLPNIQKELDSYRKQLAKNYLTDDQVTNKLMHEAYDRMKNEVHVEHILVMCTAGSDTAAPYRKIDSIYHAIKDKGASFEAMAKEYSDDKGTKDRGGDVGYITSLQTVYPFENMAYNTPIGKVSAPFRTQFGYHVIKVIDKRPSEGTVKVAQILIATPKSKGEAGVEAGRKRADSVEAMLKNGASFDDLVKKYSDDKLTVNNGGEMPVFGAGKTVPEFEKAAFALKKPGEISKPVKTDYGFHIIKLVERYPLQPYDSMVQPLKHKVENDSRAQTARDMFAAKIKERNGFKEYTENLEPVVQKLNSMPDTGKKAHMFRASDFSGMSKPLFTLAGKNYLQSDFVSYAETITRGRLMGPKATVVRDLYKNYVNTVVNDFEEHKLVNENPDFKLMMEEYRDGIMLFELMDRNVWSKASKDTAGLKEFYDTHKDKYMWEPGFKGAVYKFKNEEALKQGKALLEKNTPDEDLVKEMNGKSNPDMVSVQRGRYEFSRFKDAPRSALVAGKITEATKNSDGTYTVVKVDEVYNTSTNKTLDEARGYVVTEYQDYLEKQWNERMRKKYPVKVNETVFKSMVK